MSGGARALPERRLRAPTSVEIELWRQVTRDIAPLPGRELPAAREEPASAPIPSLEADSAAAPDTLPVPRAATPPPPPRPTPLDPDRPVGLDRRTWQRLKRGRITIEQTLDLHGQTQAQAHERLARFLAEAQTRGRRCVLVVTGKGQANGGVLRHMVPRWLNEGANRERIIAYCHAQRHHGGAGALYVLIRRGSAA